MPDVDEVIARHWRIVLGLEHADPAANFFDMGGDSLAAMELVERVEEELGATIPLEVVFVEGTLEAITTAVRSQQLGPS